MLLILHYEMNRFENYIPGSIRNALFMKDAVRFILCEITKS